MLKRSLVIITTIFLVSIFSIPTFADMNADATAEAILSQDNHSTTKVDATQARPYAGPVPIPGQPAWFATETLDGSFQPLANILQYGHVFTEGALESIKSNGSVRVNYLIGNDENEVPRANGNKIKITTTVPKFSSNIKFIAYANGDAKNGKTNSIQVMAAIALKAIRNGANIIYFSREGFHRKIEAFGWGIGASGTVANENSMSTPGLGISGGNAGPEDRPWLQGAAFVDPNLKL